MQSFLKPLNAKEEAEQLTLLKAGSVDARASLIEHNLRLVAHIVKKYNLPDRDMDDYISIGTIGLIKAIDTFKPEKGIRLATYASRCIDNELLMMFRSNRKQSRETYLYEPIGADREGNEITLLDIIEADDSQMEDQLQNKDSIKRLKALLENVLTQREREILLLRYGLYGNPEVTQREIADRFRISRSYVSRLESKALTKLRMEFERNSD